MAYNCPPCPPQYKNIQHYLKVATEHDQRDPIISYWCRLYALQLAMKIDKKSDEAKRVLLSLMDWLEKQKSSQKENEAITNDMAAQAYIENYALKIFLWADSQDRASIFNKNVVKSFYTAGMLFDVMDTFGELPENLAQNKKYAKWKASYIHNCLKNGETPIPGPMGMEEGENEENAVGGASLPPAAMGFIQPGFPDFPTGHDPGQGGTQFPYNPPPSTSITPTDVLPDVPTMPASPFGMPQPRSEQPQPIPTQPAPSIPVPAANEAVSSGGSVLNPEQVSKAQKYCKWASSALNYDDIPTAITNLQKALHLLQTGQDS